MDCYADTVTFGDIRQGFAGRLFWVIFFSGSKVADHRRASSWRYSGTIGFFGKGEQKVFGALLSADTR